MNAPKKTPPGYWKDADGRLIPEDMVKPIDRTRDQLVRELIDKARDISGVIARFKGESFAEIAAFIDLSAGEYGVKIGGNKGNVTLVTFDGQYKIVRQVAEALVFDERLQAAKELIDQCIKRWAEGTRSEIQALINDAFQVNKEGHISTGRVLGLKRLNISDPEWLRAMQAIADSVRVAGSKPYLRFYERVEGTDQYQPISLDLAAV